MKMSRRWRSLAAFALAVSMLAAPAAHAAAAPVVVTAVKDGWISQDGGWYYAKNGAYVKGWQEIEGAWYYFDTSGRMQTGWQEIGGKWYYFASSGKMATGWQKIGSKWYYFTSSGTMKTGWLQDGGYWYYLKTDGSMAVSESVGKYTFDSKGHWIQDVLPEDDLTYANVLALLDGYDPDGAFIIRNTSEQGTMSWVDYYDKIGDAINRYGTMVHEQCHEYTESVGPFTKNNYTGMYLPGGERIYLGNKKSMVVKMTMVFDTREMVSDIPEELHGNRFDTYVDTDEIYMASRQHGIYGLFNEFTAYCWGMNANNKLESFADVNGLYMYDTDEYLSWAEFRYYMLKYLLYAEEHYPEVYQDIIDNDSFRTAFTTVDTKFQGVVNVFLKNHPNRYSGFDRTFNALVAEMKKKEYLDLVELLKP